MNDSYVVIASDKLKMTCESMIVSSEKSKENWL